MSEVFTVAFL